jgi:hypothetical protein
VKNNKKKRYISISYLFFLTGFIVMSIVAYFLIQTMRESLYQDRFDNQYEFISLKEENVIDPVQVFHGVKLNTFHKEDESNKGSGTIIFEIKDEIEAELKEVNLDSDHEGMSAFHEAILYKKMKETNTGKESFIIAMQLPPETEKLESSSGKFRTYMINENGVIKESQFSVNTKSKQETQWIRGLSGETYGYYTDLPYQKGGYTSLIFLGVFGIIMIIGGIWTRRIVSLTEKGEAA